MELGPLCSDRSAPVIHSIHFDDGMVLQEQNISWYVGLILMVEKFLQDSNGDHNNL